MEDEAKPVLLLDAFFGETEDVSVVSYGETSERELPKEEMESDCAPGRVLGA